MRMKSRAEVSSQQVSQKVECVATVALIWMAAAGSSGWPQQHAAAARGRRGLAACMVKNVVVSSREPSTQPERTAGSDDFQI
jgi:hypothetical protein